MVAPPCSQGCDDHVNKVVTTLFLKWFTALDNLVTIYVLPCYNLVNNLVKSCTILLHSVIYIAAIYLNFHNFNTYEIITIEIRKLN